MTGYELTHLKKKVRVWKTQKEKSYYFYFHEDDVTWPFSASPVSGALSYGKWIFSSLFSAGNLLQSHAGQVCLMHNHSHAHLSFQFVSCIKSFQHHVKNISRALKPFLQWCHFTTATRSPLLIIFLIEMYNGSIPLTLKTIKKALLWHQPTFDINQHQHQPTSRENGNKTLLLFWNKNCSLII